MIAKNSTSYPYLAIAQHYNISYAEVLRYADSNSCQKGLLPATEWKQKIWWLEANLRYIRKQ